MDRYPELIVMLTHNDHTVENAYSIFDQYKDAKANYWGFKEKGIPLEEMKALCAYMKEMGKTTVLEVVAYTEAECIEGAETAAVCGCDILMGTLFFDSVNAICQKHGIKYMPFVGKVTERPSVLNGTAEEMIAQANACLKKGVYGIDLLGYRYTGDAAALNTKLVSGVSAPVCIAGSIDSFEKLDQVKASGAWAFTIGGAFFKNKFGDDFGQQINKVYDYIHSQTPVPVG